MRKILKGVIICLFVMDFVFIILCIWVRSDLSLKLMSTSCISTLAFYLFYGIRYYKITIIV